MQEEILVLQEEAEKYIRELYKKLPPAYGFHNLEHTEKLVQLCQRMAEHYQLETEDREILLVAAWFLHSGVVNGSPGNHNVQSQANAREFLINADSEEKFTQKVLAAIEAAGMPQSPVSKIEKILADADMAYLCSKEFKEKHKALKAEQEEVTGQKVPRKKWNKDSIDFLESHQFFTDYFDASALSVKEKNLEALQQRREKKKAKPSFPLQTENGTSKADAEADEKLVSRGIQTLFRTLSENHVELSKMADSKANIMISVNAIILSVVLTVLLPRLPYYPQFVLPTVLLVIVSLLSIVIAILATRPTISKGKFTEEEVREKKVNLLFFGNYHNMKFEDYNWGMNEIMKDKTNLHEGFLRDVYSLGLVLSKKYKFLRLCYTIFMFGLVIAVIAFGIAYYQTQAGSAVDTIDY
jgi:predicted metal-dependent HD superfamily phosphohydrolase